MKKNFSIGWASVLFLLLFSCSSDKATETVVGKWQQTTVADEAPQQTLALNQSETDNTFILENWKGDTLQGNWTKSNDSLSLTYFEIGTFPVDSMTITNDHENNPGLTLYQEGMPVGEMHEGEMTGKEMSILFRLVELGDERLALENENQIYHFQKVQKQAQSLSFFSVIRGVFGIMALIIITFLFSGNKKRIDWGLVAKGTALQIIIAILVLKVPLVESGFQAVSEFFVWIIRQTDAGVDFLFGQMGIGEVQAPLITFAVKVLPTIIFFSALMSAFYYLGVVQKIVYAFAWVMKKFMRLSGSESLAAAGNVFLGQTESPLLVKPYLLVMTKSEMMCLMTGGMATIAGGVLAAYISFLGGDDPVQQAFFAKHLLTASIISAPAAIVAAKILVPETEEINQNLKIDKQKIGTNLLEAISNGTSDGLKLAVNVGAMLLVFIALMALGNGVLEGVGEVTGLNDVIASNTPYKDGLSFQFILGYIGAPIVWLIGVEGTDIVAVGELLGQKTVLNEFIAYPRLGEMREAGTLSEKSIIMSTYMLCGFSNFASIGIQIGGIGSLVPSRKGLLSQLGMKALIGGTVASLMTAAIVGMLY